MHDCPCCGQAVYSASPVVLCDYCRTEGPCAPVAWHCRCGRSCDGSACPGPGGVTPERSPGMGTYNLYDDTEYRNGSTCGPDCEAHR